MDGTRPGQIDYALRFRGDAERGGVDGNLLRIAGRSSGCSISTSYRDRRLHGVVRDEPGDDVLIESELTITGPTSFQEVAVLTFGPGGDRLHLSSRGGGVLEPHESSVGQRGAGILSIDGGEGHFARATGLIVATYRITESGRVLVAHLGVIDVRI